MKNYTSKRIYEECQQSGFYYPRVILRVWFVEVDDMGQEIDRGCKDIFSRRQRKFSTYRGTQNFIANERGRVTRFADSRYPEAVWVEDKRGDAGGR